MIRRTTEKSIQKHEEKAKQTNLLRLDINTRQPASKARVRMIPADDHFWSSGGKSEVQRNNQDVPKRQIRTDQSA